MQKMYTAAQNEVQATIYEEGKKFIDSDKMAKLRDADLHVKQFITMDGDEYIQKFSKAINDELTKQVKEIIIRANSE